MTKFLFAVAAVALIASAGVAEEKPVVVQPVTPTPVVVGTPGTPVVEYAPATPARRGLFGRLRNRNAGTTTMSGPATTVVTPGTVIAPAPIPMPPVAAPQPMPSPVVKPISGVVVPGTAGIVVAGGPATVPGTVVVAGGMMDTNVLMPVGYTEPVQSKSERRGLFGRLRNR